jgi:cardiolipin synthase
VRVLLAGKSDVRLMQVASRSLYRRLLLKGIGLWEYQPQILHSKLIVIDDIVYVGSSNLDPRSLRINFEVMLRVRDPRGAGQVRQQFDEDLSTRSLPVTLESIQLNRSLWQRIAQRLAYWLFVHFDPDMAAIRQHTWRDRKEKLVRRLK